MESYTCVTYCLKDNNGIPFYIGATCKGLESRLRNHISHAKKINSRCDLYLFIYSINKKITIEALETITYNGIDYRSIINLNTIIERKWIEYHENKGIRVFNRAFNKNNYSKRKKCNEIDLTVKERIIPFIKKPTYPKPLPVLTVKDYKP